jgi:hypothetical protein
MSGSTVPPVPASPEERDGQHDFDFQWGKWKVHNRRLLRPLTGSTDWVEFEATCEARPLFGGLANEDEFSAETPTGSIRGMTIRMYDPKSHEWTIYWGRLPDGALTLPPVVGRFNDRGVGEFYDHELFNGRAIFLRYTWKVLSKDRAEWEQAFSVDGGRTWETNWYMVHTRVG